MLRPGRLLHSRCICNPGMVQSPHRPFQFLQGYGERRINRSFPGYLRTSLLHPASCGLNWAHESVLQGGSAIEELLKVVTGLAVLRGAADLFYVGLMDPFIARSARLRRLGRAVDDDLPF